jgi:8-oxo-dGTP pyrophosphatase MutT (NUDIX family)
MTAAPVTEATRHFTASAAVFDVGRRAVLLVGHILTGRRQFPGGHVDPDETGDECALREVGEETGVAARLWAPGRVDVRYGRWLPAPFMVAEHPAAADPAWGAPAHAHIDLLYVATADSAAPTSAQEDEVSAAEWLPVDGIAARDVRADVPVVVPAAWAWLTGEAI